MQIIIKTKAIIRNLLIAVSLLGLIPVLAVSAAIISGDTRPVPHVASAQQVDFSKIQHLRIPFIANQGQIPDKRVGFYVKTFGATLYVTQNGEMTYAFSLRKPGEDKLTGWVLKELMEDAAKISPAGVERAQTKVSYFKGNDQSKWKTNIATYNELHLGEVYQGIHLNLKAYGNSVEKIFTLKPGAGPQAIRLKIEGTLSLEVNAAGELVVHTGLGPVRFSKPIAFQEINGKRQYIQAAYVAKERSYGFRVGKYDQRFPLIIDPTLIASSFLGGSGGGDYGLSVVLDSSNNAYVTGYTYAFDFPTTSGAYDTSPNGIEGDWDVFVSKLDSGLGTLSASTYIGGGSGDEGRSITLDNSGNVYVTGYTESSDYPTTAGAYDTIHNMQQDVFVSKLNSSLSTLSASTFIGGDEGDVGNSIRLDSSGNVYVTGYTTYTSGTVYPTTSDAYDTSFNGTFGQDVFVSKLDSGLSTLSASTFIGGEGDDVGESIRLDRSGAYVYVTGYTYKAATDYPTTSGAYDTTHNNPSSGTDVFVSKLDSGLSTLSASTFIGGDADDYGKSLALDTSANVYVTGYTEYTTGSAYPTTRGAYDESLNGREDVFVSKLDSGLSSLSASTFVGGSEADHAYSIVLDSSNYVHVTGYANKAATDYPTTPGAYDTSHNNPMSGPDVFVSELNPDLSSLTYSTFLGGASSEYGQGIDIDSSSDNVFVTGYTWSTENDDPPFPVTAGAYDTTHNGGANASDAFIAKFSLGTTGNSAPSTPTAVSPANNTTFAAGPVTLQASTYSDPEGDSHISTIWKVRKAGMPFGKSDYPASFLQTTTSGDLTQHEVTDVISGMKYFWTAGYTDLGSRSTSTSSESAFIVGTSTADGNVSISSGETASEFEMVSFIQFADDPAATSVLGDEVGSYDTANFRIGSYDPLTGGYVEYGGDLKIEPGKSYWFLCLNGLSITVNGIPVTLNESIEVELKYNSSTGNGWNMIGSPNNANYAWANVQVVVYDDNGKIIFGPVAISSLTSANAYIDIRLWRYSDGSYYSDTTLIEKYNGYWVKAKQANVYLIFAHTAQAAIRPGFKVMLADLFQSAKRWGKEWIFASSEAVADAGDSPPAPIGGFTSNAAEAASGGGGCFIATAADESPVLPLWGSTYFSLRLGLWFALIFASVLLITAAIKITRNQKR